MELGGIILLIIFFIFILFLIIFVGIISKKNKYYKEDRRDEPLVNEVIVYSVNYPIVNLTELTAKNNINIESITFFKKNNLFDISYIIVDDPILFQSLLEKNNIDYSKMEGFSVSGFPRESGVLNNLVEKIEKFDKIKLIFFDENGNLIFVLYQKIKLKKFIKILNY